MSKLEETAGDLIKIPFNDSTQTYGRILVDGSYAIYDSPCSSDIEDYEKIIKSSILFTAYVETSVVKKGLWPIIKNIPLEANLKNFYPRYFNPAPTNPVNLNFYKVYKEEIEDAIKKDWIKTGKLQLGGIYGRVHIEQRINDYYAGTRNENNKANIYLFKQLTGLLARKDEDVLFKNDSKEVTGDGAVKDYNKRLTETEHFYALHRWKEFYENGFKRYSPEIRREAQFIFESLINDLIKIGEHAPDENKIGLLIHAVKAFNQINDRSEGALIETNEREELCEFFNQVTIAVGLSPGDYGGGEGIASEFRDW